MNETSVKNAFMNYDLERTVERSRRGLDTFDSLARS